jgi:hypothetical protein
MGSLRPAKGLLLPPFRYVGQAVQEMINLLQGPKQRLGSAETAWNEYLNSLMIPQGPIAPEVISRVWDIWHQACVQVKDCPRPITQPTDEGAIQLAWDYGERYLDVEVFPAGGIHWYFRNRQSGEVVGTENPVSSLPLEFFEELRDTTQVQRLR